MLARLNRRFHTPHWAIIAGGVVGIAAIYSDKLLTFGGNPLTVNIVTMSVFGAIVMYIISMASHFRLRAREPNLTRPFCAPVYPFFPLLALVLAVLSLAAMIIYNLAIFAAFLVLFVLFAPLAYNVKRPEENSILLQNTTSS